jgi:hypothetical protein
MSERTTKENTELLLGSMAKADAPGQSPIEEPSVIGAVGGPSTPSRLDAEVAWRRLYVDRMVARGIDRQDAQSCCDAGDVDLSSDPSDAADAEMEYWTND